MTADTQTSGGILGDFLKLGTAIFDFKASKGAATQAKPTAEIESDEIRKQQLATQAAAQSTQKLLVYGGVAVAAFAALYLLTKKS